MNPPTKSVLEVGVMLPGQRSPSVGFEAPFEMLEACHERAERMLDLLTRLKKHVKQNGCDAQAAAAALDVMRYFDLAAPLHHQDEELHVFPAVLSVHKDSLDFLVYRLRQEHLEMEKMWRQVRQTLSRVVQEDVNTISHISPEDQSEMDAFVAIYKSHIRSEESLVIPEARRLLNSEQMSVISREMFKRRCEK